MRFGEWLRSQDEAFEDKRPYKKRRPGAVTGAAKAARRGGGIAAAVNPSNLSKPGPDNPSGLVYKGISIGGPDYKTVSKIHKPFSHPPRHLPDPYHWPVAAESWMTEEPVKDPNEPYYEHEWTDFSLDTGRGGRLARLEVYLRVPGFASTYGDPKRPDLAGKFIAEQHPEYPEHLFTASTAVHPAFQRKGFGREMLDHALGVAKARGFKGFVSDPGGRREPGDRLWNHVRTRRGAGGDYMEGAR